MKQLVCLLILSSLFACTSNTEQEALFDIQGHRGARGLAPENSIPGFLLAAKLGVTTLELDVIVSKDHQLVVSHEPYLSPTICADLSGGTLPSDSVINLYELNYEEIRRFDCGSKGNQAFPDQKAMPSYKPLLTEMIDSVEAFVNANGTAVRYNIELKSRIDGDDTYHPTPEVFVDLMYAALTSNNLLERVTIQSFDFRILQQFRKRYANVALVLLIANELPWQENIDSLGFYPNVYSPYYPLLSQENIKEMQSAGLKVIPWTVNEIPEMKQLIEWDVDGIITDYPDRLIRIIKE